MRNMGKMCWLAKETKKGWKLGIADDVRNYFIPKFFSMAQIQNLRKRKLLVTLPLVDK